MKKCLHWKLLKFWPFSKTSKTKCSFLNIFQKIIQKRMNSTHPFYFILIGVSATESQEKSRSFRYKSSEDLFSKGQKTVRGWIPSPPPGPYRVEQNFVPSIHLLQRHTDQLIWTELHLIIICVWLKQFLYLHKII